MAVTDDYASFVADQLAGLAGLTMKRMFGGYVLHLRGRVLGFLFDDEFYLEPGPAAFRLLPDAERRPLFPGSKKFIIFPDVDNALLIREVAEAVWEDLPLPKPRRSSGHRSSAHRSSGRRPASSSSASSSSASSSSGGTSPEIESFLDFYRSTFSSGGTEGRAFSDVSEDGKDASRDGKKDAEGGDGQ